MNHAPDQESVHMMYAAARYISYVKRTPDLKPSSILELKQNTYHDHELCNPLGNFDRFYSFPRGLPTSGGQRQTAASYGSRSYAEA